MRNLRGLGTQAVLLVACIGCAGQAYAACNGPQALVAQFTAHPTAQRAITLGSWYASHNQYACAADTFRSGVKADPKNAQLHYLTGLALVFQKRTADAIPELKKSSDLAPSELKPRLMLATAYLDTNQPAEAEAEWRKVLEIDPRSEEALQSLGALYMRRKDYPSVIQLLQNAPRNETMTVMLGNALAEMGFLDKAEDLLSQALDANRQSIPLADAMRVVLVRERKYEEAIKLQRVVAKDHPDNLDAQENLYKLLVLANHFDEARPMGPKLLAARPHDPDVLYLNGMVQRAVGDYPGAKKLLEDAVQRQPDFFNSRYQLGMVLVLLHEYPEAKTHLEKAIELGVPGPEVHFELAKALRGLGDSTGANEEVKKYQEIKKAQDAQLEAADEIAQADGELGAGKAKEAVEHYREGVRAQPSNADYRYKFAIALHQAGEEDAVREQLEQAVKLDPKLAGAQNALGYLLSQSGDAQGAITHFRAAVDAAPNWVDAWINLAAKLAEAGQLGEARTAVSRALAIDPANTQAHELSDQLARDPRAQAEHP
jgi:tetratricopeptide (TPR) repeat protein